MWLAIISKKRFIYKSFAFLLFNGRPDSKQVLVPASKGLHWLELNPQPLGHETMFSQRTPNLFSNNAIVLRSKFVHCIFLERIAQARDLGSVGFKSFSLSTAAPQTTRLLRLPPPSLFLTFFKWAILGLFFFIFVFSGQQLT